MELSLYLGQLLSIALVVIGLALLLRLEHYTKVYKALVKEGGLLLLTGMFVLVAGLAIVLVHNVWVSSWEVIITVVGWGMVLKGVLLLLLPKEMEKLTTSVMKMKWLLPLGAVVWVIAGLYLGYYAWA